MNVEDLRSSVRVLEGDRTRSRNFSTLRKKRAQDADYSRSAR